MELMPIQSFIHLTQASEALLTLLQLFMDHGYLKQLRQMIILLLIGIIN
jgi:hypothetical protein